MQTHLQLQQYFERLYNQYMQRQTKQRSAINQALVDEGRPLLPQEILAKAQESVPNLNLATVYRNLNLMVEEGVIEAVHLPGQTARFEIMGHHHHHFYCKSCDRVYDIHACNTEIDNLAPKGFKVDDHDLILYGKCPDCRQ